MLVAAYDLLCPGWIYIRPIKEPQTKLQLQHASGCHIQIVFSDQPLLQRLVKMCPEHGP